jgi:hypothetical protein
VKKLKYVDGLKGNVWSDDMTSSIQDLLVKKYAPFLQNEEFVVESGKNREQLQIRMNLRGKDGGVEYPVESVYPYDEGSERDLDDVVMLMLDYLDSYWHEYLSSGRDTFLTLDWSKHTCEGVDFFVRGFVRHVALEAEADRLLEEEGPGDYVFEKISSES